MNDEKLIELVRENTALYDFQNVKYSDNNFKEKIWSAIAQELNVSQGVTCKNRWNQLRDQWRKNKKTKVVKSEQSLKFIKPWRYDEQMDFLEPYSRQRKTIGNFNDVDAEDEELETQENSNIGDTLESIQVTETEEEKDAALVNSPSEATSLPVHKRPRFYSKLKHIHKGKKEDTGSVLKYLVNHQIAQDSSRTSAKDPTDIFFESLAAKVKRFTPYHRNIAETKIFNLVQELELEQLEQISHQSYATCFYNQPSEYTTSPTPSNDD